MATAVHDPGVDAGGLRVLHGDLDDAGLQLALAASRVAWDSETTGLDWRSESIATVQLQVGQTTFIVQDLDDVPSRLKLVLEDPGVRKVMHHAMFDLRFAGYGWKANAASVYCTKISSKILWPDADPASHSLAPLLDRLLGVRLDKSQQVSDWRLAELSPAQLEYAANDVRFLWPLFDRLDRETRKRGLESLRDRCFAHLPTRVELELRGYCDVFAY